MNILLLDPRQADTPGATFDLTAEEGIRRGVHAILGSTFGNWRLSERRSQQRYPYPYLVHLTPLANDGSTTIGETVVVVGKHLSAAGLDFYFPEPLPYRRMIAALESRDGRRWGFLLELSSCRFTASGWYVNGGRFLRTATPPSVEGNQTGGQDGLGLTVQGSESDENENNTDQSSYRQTISEQPAGDIL